jgi:YVTN family beta-propeller protein
MARSFLVTLMMILLLCGCSGSGSNSQPATLVAITVAPSALSIAPGTTTQFRATGNYSDGALVDLTDSVTWSSSSPEVAGVSNAAGFQGVATAVTVGTSNISATSGTVSGSAVLTCAAVQSISVTPTTQVGLVGTTQQFQALATLANGLTQDLTKFVSWTSSVPATATVSPTGLASAVSAGTVTITATSGVITGSATFTVATLVSVAISPANPTIAAGATQQFAALGTLSDGTTDRDVTSLVTWSSADPAIVTITGGGTATGVSPGSTSISATFGSATQSTVVTVQGPATIAVTPANASAVAGSTQQFTATGNFADGSTRDLTTLVTWSSSLPSVATVSNAAGSKGLVAALGNGTSDITATLGLAPGPVVQGSTSLTVRALSSLAITPANPSVKIGSSLRLAATGTFSDSTTQDLANSATWTSSAPAIATVSDVAGSKGLVSAKALGSATITATFGGQSATTQVTVASTGPVASTSRAFVTNFGSGTLSVLDTDSNTVLTNITVGAGPQGVAVNPSTSLAYVANSNSGTVSVVDISSNAVLATVQVGGGPWGVALDPAANRAYIANSLSGTVSVLNTTTNTVVVTVSVGATPRGIAVDQSTGQVYVANFGSNTVSVIDSASNTVTDTVDAGAGPVDVAVNSATGRVYVANSFGTALSVLSTATNALVTNVSVGSNAQGVAVNPGANRAYVTMSSGNSLSVINTATNTLSTTIAVGGAPLGVALKPTANRIYVANSGSNTVSVIDSVTNGVIATIPGLSAPHDIAVIP